MDKIEIDWSPLTILFNGFVVELIVFAIATVIPVYILGVFLDKARLPRKVVGCIVGVGWLALAYYLITNGYVLKGMRN
ncbi:hypothetical protein MKY91_09340 [Alkalicoccobacillus gibsonii]|uniref:Uncharacterized protein n=2 Tax=Alkalicoccobacillus gibsonii TaxID=79881 RepID=A0ABU9VHH8_9BACI